MMTAVAILYVVVLWGASTAIIFYLDSLPVRTFRVSMAAATLVLVFCAAAIWLLRDDQTLIGIATSFAAGLLAWGWTEMALYMGYVTGPRKTRCQHGCAGAAHFGHAISANLWHEITVILFAAAIWWTGNATAAWCFAMLWLMHLSARLNVFLGVRNVSEEFVPAHMDVLKGFLRQRRMNALFPISILAHVVLIVLLVNARGSFAVTMAITLAIIGLLEHILLMLPLPIGKLFHWSLSSHHKTAREGSLHTDHTRKNSSKISILGTLS